MPVSSWVNSVEFIDAVISGTNNSVSYNLSKGQNYTNCIPFYTVCSNVAYWDSRLTDVYFSGTTQSGIINFSRAANRSTSNYVKCYVVEFNPEQVRVQQGTFSLTGATTQTVTLPTTISGTNRAAMTFGWKSDNTYQYVSCVAVRGRVLNTTSIDFYRNASTSTCTGHWFLFEDLGDNFRTYHVDGSHTTGQSIDISSQKTVDPLRTFLLGSYASNAANAYTAYYSCRIFQYSTGTIRSDKGSSTGTVYWAAQVVEILDQTKIYVPFDHGSAYVGWTSPATYSRSVGGLSGRVPFLCDPTTSTVVVAAMQGFVRGDSTSAGDTLSAIATAELTSNDTITFTKFGTTAVAYPSNTVVVDWAGISVDTGSNSSPISKGNGPGQSFVKSVENFRFTLSGNLGVYVLTKGQIVSNCAIFSSNRSVSSNSIRTICVNTYLKEPGLVYMQHWHDSEEAIIDVSVIEFYPDQVKVQQFNINNSTTTTVNVSITEVSSINKAFILSSIFTPYNGGPAGFQYSFYRIKFTSTTNVELYKYSSGYEVVCSFFVIEDLQNNFITEHCSQSFNSNDSLYSDNYNWGGHNSFPIVTYTANAPNDYPGYGCIGVRYHSEFRPIYCTKGAGSYTIYWYGTIVKFVDNKRHTFPLGVTLSNPSSLTQYYPSEIRGTENITAYNPMQYSTIENPSTAATVNYEAFGTIRITDYDAGIYEVSKVGTATTSVLGAHIINWTGYHYQDANNVTGTATKSFINSIQKDYFNTDGNFMQIWLRHNQDITKCVPFMSNSAASSDSYHSRTLKTIYRYDDPDCFRIRFIGKSTASRDILSYIIEFNQDIKVQHGSGYSTGTSRTFTIETVNLNRAFLIFYNSTDSWSRLYDSACVCGYFSSSSQLTFVRNTAAGGMYISWYVIECPDWGSDSYWNAQHNTTGSMTGATAYSWFTYQPNVSRSIFISSYTTNEPNGYPYYGIYRVFHRQDHGMQFDKQAGSYNLTASNTEVVEFSKDLVYKGFKVYSNFYTLIAQEGNSSLRLLPSEYFHIQRSMVLCANNENITRVDTSAIAGQQECFHYMKFESGAFFSKSKYNTTSMTHYCRTIYNGAVINVSDGDNNTYWQTTYTSVAEWISIDMGVSKSMYKVCLTALNGYNTRMVKNFKIENSSDNLNWYTTYSGITVLTGSDQFFNFSSTTAPYRYWRLYMIDHWGDTYMALSKFELYDYNSDNPDPGYSNYLSTSKVGSSYYSYNFYYAIQFPKFNKYYFSGYVTEQGDPVARKVAAYRYSTGELMDYSTSISGTGYFYLETTDYEPHYIVALDDDGGFSYNDLIYGKIYPEPIDGAFGWIADNPTVTGVGEFYSGY